MKYFIVVGERSGEMHAARLSREIKKNDAHAEIVGVGGKLMSQEGVNVLKSYKDFFFMGIWEVISNLKKIIRSIKHIKQLIKEYAPDVLILVDCPGVNLKLATFAKSQGIKTCYYISPKIWAWRSGRIKKIKQSIDKMLVIFPFETAYYSQRNFKVEYVGNPLIDAIGDYQYNNKNGLESGKNNIAILPGSRKQEIKKSIKIIKKISQKSPKYNFLLAGINDINKKLYDSFEGMPNVKIYFDRTYDILKYANAAVVTSGTATLEAALLDCPQVVVYKTGLLNVIIARLLLNVKWISLVNIIANRTVVRELRQGSYNSNTVLEELNKILTDREYRNNILSGYQSIRETIGDLSAAKNTANSIIKFAKQSSNF